MLNNRNFMQVGNRAGTADAFSRFGVKEREMLSAQEVSLIAVERRLIFFGNRLTRMRAYVQIGANDIPKSNDKRFISLVVFDKRKDVRHTLMQFGRGNNGNDF